MTCTYPPPICLTPALSPTGGAIVPAVAVTQPVSTGRVRLADRDPRSAPIIEQIDVYHHATSTAAMGLEGEDVVDALGRVYGTEALIVSDASIMPLAPGAPTNLTAMMIAEHIASRAVAQAVA